MKDTGSFAQRAGRTQNAVRQKQMLKGNAMTSDLRSSTHETFDSAPLPPGDRVRPGWQGFLLIVIGWSGIALVHATPELLGDPASGATVLGTTVVAVASLLSIGVGAAIAVVAAQSPTRYVFRSRPATWTAAVLAMASSIAVVVLSLREPFDGMAAHGKPLAELIGDLSYVAASTICVVAVVAAVHSVLKARSDERSWSTPRHRERRI
jgi:Na+-driven multidrug efflux pump